MRRGGGDEEGGEERSKKVSCCNTLKVKIYLFIYLFLLHQRFSSAHTDSIIHTQEIKQYNTIKRL